MNKSKRLSAQEDTILEIVKATLQNQKNEAGCLLEIYNFSGELFRHSINVAILSLLLGIKIGISPGEQKEIYIAGLLHDYGKLLIPENILLKEGNLTAEEREIMGFHPAAGFLCLKRNTELTDSALYAVLDHHEKADGSGYGSHKSGKSISELAKIISIADVYDAMASDRAYRKAIDINTVKEYLCINAGRSLEYNYVMCFMDILKENSPGAVQESHYAIIKSILFTPDDAAGNPYMYKAAER